MIVFLLKFGFLLLLQIGSIKNRSFSYIQCIMIDYLLRVLLNTSDWFSACDDKEEQRTWCTVKYSSSIQIFDWLLNIFYFFVPFLINCISGLIIIITAVRTRSKSQKTQSFKERLHQQIQHHKHLLISPSLFIILAIPRLIISFLSDCMRSARDSWFYLIGYFISFIPPMVTFLVFVLPSDVYKKEFMVWIKHVWKR
jgi:hypothetical protein